MTHLYIGYKILAEVIMKNNSVRLRIDEILVERRIKQKDFAAKAGLSQNTVSSLVNNGVRQIQLETIEKVCRALDVKPGDLFQID